MQRPGLFNEINFYPKSILAKEKIFYTYSKIINCSKFITPTRKKNKFPPKKNVWCSRKSMRKRNHFFKQNNILHPPEKTNFPPEKNSYTYLKKKSDEIISHSSLKKPKFHRKRISYTTTENPIFQLKKIIILSRKNPISEGKNILYLSEKNSKFLILTLPRPYPPLPVKKRFLKQKKSKILQLRCVLNTALLLF